MYNISYNLTLKVIILYYENDRIRGLDHLSKQKIELSNETNN